MKLTIFQVIIMWAGDISALGFMLITRFTFRKTLKTYLMILLLNYRQYPEYFQISDWESKKINKLKIVQEIEKISNGR